MTQREEGKKNRWKNALISRIQRRRGENETENKDEWIICAAFRGDLRQMEQFEVYGETGPTFCCTTETVGTLQGRRMSAQGPRVRSGR